MKLRHWITYSLLLSFFVLLTPRSWWHECDHDTHLHQTVSDDPHSIVHLEKKNCFACDFDLGFIDQPGSILSYSYKKIFSNPVTILVTSVQSEELPLFSKRGPPII